MDEPKKPKLNELINDYQQTKAPPGFAQRVSANLPKTRPSLIAIPGVAVAASFAVVAIVSIVIVHSIDEVDPQLKPDTHIAKPEQPIDQQQTQLAKTEPQEKPARTESPATEQQVAQAKAPRDEDNISLATVSISAEERQLFSANNRKLATPVWRY